MLKKGLHCSCFSGYFGIFLISLYFKDDRGPQTDPYLTPRQTFMIVNTYGTNILGKLHHRCRHRKYASVKLFDQKYYKVPQNVRVNIITHFDQSSDFTPPEITREAKGIKREHWSQFS